MQIEPYTQILHQGIDATWQEDDADSILAILVLKGHCIGIVFDRADQKFVYLKSFTSQDDQDFTRPQWLEDNFPFINKRPAHFFFAGIKTTIVPDALYNENLKSSFLKFNHKLGAEEKINSSFLKNLDAQFIFAENIELEKLRNAFPGATYGHPSAGWLENLCLQYKNEASDHVHIDFEEDKIDIAFFRDGSLHLFNSFLCSTDEDRLYYPLFISEQLRINPKKDNYFLSGFIEKDSETHRLFRKYIKNLEFQERPPHFKYSLPVMALPEHLYYKAFSIPVCVL